MSDHGATIRPPQGGDIVPYAGFLANPEVSVWLDDTAQVPISAARVESILLHEAWALWSIECDGVFVGVTSLYDPDLNRGTGRFSIVIGDQKYWRKGVGTAVIAQVMEHAFLSLGLRKVESDILAPNLGAIIIHQQAGFVEEGRLRQDAWRRGEWVDRVLMSLLREDWEKNNGAQ